MIFLEKGVQSVLKANCKVEIGSMVEINARKIQFLDHREQNNEDIQNDQDEDNFTDSYDREEQGSIGNR
jgi:hypothetical protein